MKLNYPDMLRPRFEGRNKQEIRMPIYWQPWVEGERLCWRGPGHEPYGHTLESPIKLGFADGVPSRGEAREALIRFAPVQTGSYLKIGLDCEGSSEGLVFAVKDVSVERLQEITPEGAILEGIEPCQKCAPSVAVRRFRSLWDLMFKHQLIQADGPKTAAWKSNPWVYVAAGSVEESTGIPIPDERTLRCV